MLYEHEERQQVFISPHSDPEVPQRDPRQMASGAWLWFLPRWLPHKVGLRTCPRPEPGWVSSPLPWIHLLWLVSVGAGVYSRLRALFTHPLPCGRPPHLTWSGAAAGEGKGGLRAWI